MLPIRFIAENLGCLVEWNANLREVKVTYQYHNIKVHCGGDKNSTTVPAL